MIGVVALLVITAVVTSGAVYGFLGEYWRLLRDVEHQERRRHEDVG